MRRLFGWMAGLAGIAALARLLSARKARLEAPPPPPTSPDPAAALREKLAEARGDPSADGPEGHDAGDTLDERRARIHAKAQEAIDAMQQPPS